jgi:hypothetical protein
VFTAVIFFVVPALEDTGDLCFQREMLTVLGARIQLALRMEGKPAR